VLALLCSLHALMLCLIACGCLHFACGMLAIARWSADARACVSLDAGHACEPGPWGVPVHSKGRSS